MMEYVKRKENGDMIFRTFNTEIPRVAFESMHEGFVVSSDAIDVWSMTMAFDLYLESVNHPNATRMSKAKTKILNMVWQTRTNYLDARIFLMRHMECFDGRKKGFNTGFQVERKQQIRLLNGLRRKYLVKMLMTSINEKEDQVEEEAMECIKYNDNQKSNLEENELRRLYPRVSKYYDENEVKLKKV
nr:hypothetical protein [Tanacetum cinerariifolium]